MSDFNQPGKEKKQGAAMEAEPTTPLPALHAVVTRRARVTRARRVGSRRQNQSRKTTKAHRLPRRQVWEVTQYHCDGQLDNARTALTDYAMHGRRPYTRDPLRISRDTND